MRDTAVVRVEHAGKKFSRSLKRSILYGIRDSALNTIGLRTQSDALRAGEFWAVKDVSFEVKPGEMLGVIGANGAGKSTLLKMLNGLFLPDRGYIEIRGITGALIEVGAGFHPLLTGRENIYVSGAILGMPQKVVNQRLDEIVEFSGLSEFLDTPVKFYSSGMYVRLGFSVAAHLKSDVLLIDEILSVGDVSFQSRCFNKIGEMRSAGTAILFVSHTLHHIAGFCNRVIYLDDGVIKYAGEPAAAIAAYTTDMLERETNSSNSDGRDMSQVNGTGRVVITGVSFIDQSGTIVKQIQTGDPVTLRVFYRSLADDIESPLLDVVIRDGTPGNMFQATNRDFDVNLGRIGRQGYIDILFKSISSNNKILDFFVTLWNADHTEQFDWKRYIKLQVVGHGGSSGNHLFECDWRNFSGEQE